MKDIQIIYRKLGRHKAVGLAYQDDNLIEIDDRQKGYEFLDTLIHEIIHIQNPTWNELKVIGHSKQLSKILWDLGFRKCDL
jgi:hypothetical protein